jgi:hypothetical protein
MIRDVDDAECSQAMFDAVDDSGDNLVSFDEYMQAMGQLPDRDHK